jgi:hypothetical protein
LIASKKKELMLIAKQQKQENIAEYLLYMWQIEDMIRACGFDLTTIKKHLIESVDTSEETKKERCDWYENLMLMMCNENIKEQGHLQINRNTLAELYEQHLLLLQSEDEIQYHQAYQRVSPYITELQNKQKETQTNEIEICFNALYLILMMKLQQKEISVSTQEAMQHISHLVKILSFRYRENENK